MDPAGNLYGTTTSGGAYGFGTVFKLDSSGNETVLYSFTGSPSDGSFPSAELIIDQPLWHYEPGRFRQLRQWMWDLVRAANHANARGETASSAVTLKF
jgi:uncharacterized repeat protein (TIGR03803 family)